MKKIEQLIKKLELQPHPEGGFYKQTYQSKDKVVPITGRYNKEHRSSSTSIYYLLGEHDFSAFHRIKSDELWNFCSGSPLTLYIIEKTGHLKIIIIGDPLITDNAQYQYCVEGGQWFCAKLTKSNSSNENDYALVTCTVSPGFDYKDWELAERDSLISTFPQHESLIKDFTRVENEKKLGLSLSS